MVVNWTCHVETSLVPRPHPLNREKGLVNWSKILEPDMNLTMEACSPNQIAARIINNIPVRNPLQFFYPDEYQYSDSVQR